MRIVAAVVALVMCVHAGFGLCSSGKNRPPVSRPRSPASRIPPTPARNIPTTATGRPPEQIRADLKLISPYTRAIRTYSSTGGVELVPAIATEFGLKVTVGIWLDKNESPQRARDPVRHRARQALPQRQRDRGRQRNHAARGKDRRRAHQDHPARQAHEPGAGDHRRNLDVWLDHPELASAVDFIAAHILPYWEGVPADQVVDLTIDAYDKLRRAHPGKRIVIAEFGWPSAGYNMLKANPGRIEQASILRDFVARAEAYGIDYNIIEAIDQPWKTNEGGVGPYWGMFDAVAPGEIRLDRAGQRSRLLEARRPRAAARAAAVAAAPGARPRYRRRGAHAGGRRQCGRRLVRRRLRVLEDALLRARRGLRARLRPACC